MLVSEELLGIWLDDFEIWDVPKNILSFKF